MTVISTSQAKRSTPVNLLLKCHSTGDSGIVQNGRHSRLIDSLIAGQHDVSIRPPGTLPSYPSAHWSLGCRNGLFGITGGSVGSSRRLMEFSRIWRHFDRAFRTGGRFRQWRGLRSGSTNGFPAINIFSCR